MTNPALLSKSKFRVFNGGWVPWEPRAAKAAVPLIGTVLLRRGQLLGERLVYGLAKAASL